jgi:diguanylate cyclase (GGDEF)-like protein
MRGNTVGHFLMNAHIPTLFLVIIVVGVALCVLVASGARRSSHDGLRLWAAALAMHTGAYVLLSLRGRISDLVTIVIANAMLSATFALFAEALYQFQQRPPPRWRIWLPVALVVVSFYFLREAHAPRLILGPLIFTGQCVLVLHALLQKRHETIGRGQHFVAVAFVLVIAIFVLRFLGLATGSVETLSLLASNPVQGATFLVSIVCLIILSLGLVVMTKERSDERNRVLAMQDELTGLTNRRSILDALEQQLAMARRSGQSLSLLMLDLDHFKRVNDSFGHLAGDAVLRQVAAGVGSRLRAQDIAGRYGGEEFLVILPGTTVDGAVQLAEELRKSIAADRIETGDGRAITITISIGVSGGVPAPDQRVEDLIGASDQALYRAKENGRDRVERWCPEVLQADTAVPS